MEMHICYFLYGGHREQWMGKGGYEPGRKGVGNWIPKVVRTDQINLGQRHGNHHRKGRKAGEKGTGVEGSDALSPPAKHGKIFTSFRLKKTDKQKQQLHTRFL